MGRGAPRPSRASQPHFGPFTYRRLVDEELVVADPLTVSRLAGRLEGLPNPEGVVACACSVRAGPMARSSSAVGALVRPLAVHDIPAGVVPAEDR